MREGTESARDFNPIVWCVGIFLLHTIGVGFLATTGIQASDSSEFVLSSVLGTRIHPPGYPVLSLWGRSFQWLSDNPIWNTAVAMGILHSAAVALLFDALYRWTKDKGLSIWVIAVLVMQPLWIRYSTIPEAFPALSLVYAGLVWLVSFDRFQWHHTCMFSLLLCIGIGTHHLFVCTVPLLLWLAWQMRRMWWVWSLGIVAGFSSYGILLLESSSNWSWGNVGDFTDLVRYFLRADYGTFQITHHAETGTWWGTPLTYIQTLIFESYGIFALGFVTLASIQRKELFLFVSWLLSSVVVLSLFGMPTSSTFISHSNRFFLSSMVLWVPFVAIAIKRLMVYLTQKVLLLRRLMIGVPLGLMIVNVPVAGRFDTRMQDWLEHSCRLLPDDALVFVAGDGAVFGSILGQELLGECEQVQFVYPRLLVYEWYRTRLEQKGIVGQTMVQVLHQHSGPVFSVLGLVGEFSALPSSVPFGGYWMQFLPLNQELPVPEVVELHLQEQSEMMELGDVQHPFLFRQSAENWPLEQWGHSWLALGEAYKSVGNEDAAMTCFDYGQQWLPN